MKKIYNKDKSLKPAIFLDRDGVINKDIKGKYITSTKQIKIYKSAIKGLKGIRNYHIIIITNQSAVGRGMMSIKDAIKINDFIVNQLKKNGIHINAVYLCPHKPSDSCRCRKPNTGLFEESKKDFKIEFGKSFMVGDKESDIIAGKRIGLKTIMVLTGQGRSEVKKLSATPDFIIHNLKELKKILFFFLLMIHSISLFSNPFEEIFKTKISDKKEVFEYDIYWGPISVGNARIEFDGIYETTNGIKAYKITAYASSNSFIDRIFKVRDTNISYLDVSFARSYGYFKKINEGKFRFTEYTIFDYKLNQFYGEYEKDGNVKKHFGSISKDVLDVLSSLFVVARSTDIHANKKTIIIVSKREKNFDVINYGIVKIKTQIGEFEAYKIEPKIGEDAIFVPKKGKSMYVYISKDKRIPLMLEAEVFIGSVKAVIRKYSKDR